MRIAFQSRRSGKLSLREKRVGGTSPDESLVEGAGNTVAIAPTSWSADGRYIAYTLRGAFPRTSDVWILPLFGDRKPFPLVHSDYLEGEAVFSPDGRWIAYTTDDSGQPNVFVQPFPEAGEKLQVSTAGGNAPIWRSDGKELYYLGARLDLDGRANRHDRPSRCRYAAGPLSHRRVQHRLQHRPDRPSVSARRTPCRRTDSASCSTRGRRNPATCRH